MHIAIGFIVGVSLVIITLKELVISTKTGFYQKIRKFLNITIFVLVTLFVCLFILSIIKILQEN